MRKFKNIHCLFEQSGTFKNEFKKLGYNAFDYDILNDFKQTDYVIDLFNEIDKAYKNEKSIFDSFTKNDLLMAFFPCTRFENDIGMHFRGDAYQLKNKDDIYKLEKDIQLHTELHLLYTIISELVIVCKKRDLKLIIENPYSTQHYLIRYWCLKPTCIDTDRRTSGDAYKKPTQYWFINIVPSYNLIMKIIEPNQTKDVQSQNKVERSMITPQYAENFIKELII